MKRRCLEIRAMRRGWKAWFGAIAATFAAARVSLPSKGTIHYRHISGTLHRSYIRSIGYGSRLYGLRARGAFGGRGTRFFAVGDPDSGLGFYPLPIRYRIGAWRYRVRHRRPPWQNPILFRSPPTPCATMTGFRRIAAITTASSTRSMGWERRSLAAITALLVMTMSHPRFRSAGPTPTDLTVQRLRASP
jgi:hypothetical protein